MSLSKDIFPSQSQKKTLLIKLRDTWAETTKYPYQFSKVISKEFTKKVNKYYNVADPNCSGDPLFTL